MEPRSDWLLHLRVLDVAACLLVEGLRASLGLRLDAACYDACGS